MIIFLHSSKTMRDARDFEVSGETPALLDEANKLALYLKSLSVKQLEKAMGLSTSMAEKTHTLIQSWSELHPTLPAIDIFLGDIYSGLQVQSFSAEDRSYAHEHLFILSGLYGVLRALDAIQPYRLEMGYKLPDITSLYTFWGDKIAKQLPFHQDIVNLSAVEYTKAVLPYFQQIDGLKGARIITPKFLTVSQKTHEPTFVTVHAKIARGAFARWIIQNRIERIEELNNFNEIGYTYAPELSSEDQPVFIAQEFKGIGLSVRLS